VSSGGRVHRLSNCQQAIVPYSPASLRSQACAARVAERLSVCLCRRRSRPAAKGAANSVENGREGAPLPFAPTRRSSLRPGRKKPPWRGRRMVEAETTGGQRQGAAHRRVRRAWRYVRSRASHLIAGRRQRAEPLRRRSLRRRSLRRRSCGTLRRKARPSRQACHLHCIPHSPGTASASQPPSGGNGHPVSKRPAQRRAGTAKGRHSEGPAQRRAGTAKGRHSEGRGATQGLARRRASPISRADEPLRSIRYSPTGLRRATAVGPCGRARP